MGELDVLVVSPQSGVADLEAPSVGWSGFQDVEDLAASVLGQKGVEGGFFLGGQGVED